MGEVPVINFTGSHAAAVTGSEWVVGRAVTPFLLCPNPKLFLFLGGEVVTPPLQSQASLRFGGEGGEVATLRLSKIEACLEFGFASSKMKK